MKSKRATPSQVWLCSRSCPPWALLGLLPPQQQQQQQRSHSAAGGVHKSSGSLTQTELNCGSNWYTRQSTAVAGEPNTPTVLFPPLLLGRKLLGRDLGQRAEVHDFLGYTNWTTRESLEVPSVTVWVALEQGYKACVRPRKSVLSCSFAWVTENPQLYSTISSEYLCSLEGELPSRSQCWWQGTNWHACNPLFLCGRPAKLIWI